MSTTIKAILKGERSAGGMWLEIYKGDRLVYAHDYFANGASGAYYKEAMEIVYDDMIAAAEYNRFEGCDRDENDRIVPGGPIDVLTYYPRSGKWVYGEGDTCGADMIWANRSKLPKGVVDAMLADYPDTYDADEDEEL